MKTILAFAEERGVRYRPKRPRQALVPVPVQHPHTLPQRMAGPHHATPVPFPHARDANERFVHVTANRPRWSADASFRVSFGRSAHASSRSGFPGVLRTAGVVAAALCVAIAVGRPSRVEHAAAPTTSLSASQATIATPVAAGTLRPSRRGGQRALDRPPPTPPVAEPAVQSLARLEGVVMIGEKHRATFRTPAHSVTLSEGSWIGKQRVGAIDPDRVHLVTRSGETRTLHLGHEAVVD